MNKKRKGLLPAEFYLSFFIGAGLTLGALTAWSLWWQSSVVVSELVLFIKGL